LRAFWASMVMHVAYSLIKLETSISNKMSDDTFYIRHGNLSLQHLGVMTQRP
jgi:hypothetical protein